MKFPNEFLFLGDAGNSSDPVGHGSSSQSDDQLLDAYSRAVVDVVDQLSPAVVSISRAGKRGSGSGFLITPDGYAITNSHVANGSQTLVALTSDGDQR